ncbi:MAG TPA: hypothetical protein VLE44_02635 [Candidatus Saccharimonadales bacterium]|nr:hypothetical protein [Candidatus Saccharimonadales bacterium]
MPVEIFIDDKHFTELGPKKDGVVIPDFISISWSGDNDPNGGTARVVNLKTMAWGEGDIPEKEGRVFLVKVAYMNTPFCKDKPIFYKHEVFVRWTETNQSI